MLSSIKAVIFDWGGVLIENPTEGILQYSREYLGIGAGCMLAAYRKLMPYFQEGKISEEEFWKGVRRRTGAKRQMPESLWLAAFEKSYVEKNDVFAVAVELYERGYRTGILSNTERPARPLMNGNLTVYSTPSCFPGKRVRPNLNTGSSRSSSKRWP